MVGLVSGNVLGLENTSLRTLGRLGEIGDASYGARAEQAFVNIASGNLVLQDQDEWFAGVGGKTTALRTYNSLGLLTGANPDNWIAGNYTRRLVIATDGEGSETISRQTPDGATVVFKRDPVGTYLSTDGAGAYDTIAIDKNTAGYIWTDGATGGSERYDATGLLIALSDDRGNTLTFQYSGGRLERMLNEAQEGFRFTYTATGRLSSVRFQSQDGTETVRTYYAYDALGRLSRSYVDLSPGDKSTKDGDQLLTSYAYDGETARIVSVTQRDGSALQFTYVRIGEEYRVETVTDAQGALTRFSYDLEAGRTTVTGPNGGATAFYYGPAGELVRVELAGDSGTVALQTFGYTEQGDVASVTDAMGRTMEMQYDARGNCTYERNGIGEVVERVYDLWNRLTRETTSTVRSADVTGTTGSASSSTSAWVYESGRAGRLRFEVSAEGRVTEHEYGPFGLLATTWAYPSVTLSEWDPLADEAVNLAKLSTWSIGQRAGATRIDYAYDHRGQVESMTTWTQVDHDGLPVAEAGCQKTRYAYDHLGQLLQRAAGGNATLYAYDGAGRLIAETNGVGDITTYEYGGGSGRYVTTRAANGLVTTKYLDKRGQVIASAEANTAGTILGRSYRWYDQSGNLVMTKDPVGTRTWMLYDEANRKVADIDARGAMTEYVRDASGNVVQAIQYGTAVNVAALADATTGLPTLPQLASIRPSAAADRKSWNAYDDIGRMVRTVTLEKPGSPAGSVSAIYYGVDGRVTATVEFAQLVDTTGWGSTIAIQEATPNRTPEDRETIIFNDRDGLQVGRLDPEGYLTQFIRDGAGRVLIEQRFATPIEDARRHDPFESLIPMDQGDDQVIRYFHNSAGQVTGVVDAEGYLLETVYDEAGNRIASIRYNNRAMVGDGQSSTLDVVRPVATSEDQTESWEYDKLSRVLCHVDHRGLRTDYVYDKGGNVAELVTTDSEGAQRSTQARYDLNGRLVAELGPAGTARLRTAASALEQDAVWASDARRYTYDAAGHRTSETDASGNRTVFYYSATGEETFRINGEGEVVQTRRDLWGRAIAVGRYGTAIATSDLSGGVDNTKPTRATTLIASSTLDSWVRQTYRFDDEVLSETDALGNSTTYQYDAFGDLRSSSLQLGAGRVYEEARKYDHRGLLTSWTRDVGGDSLTTRYTYDAFGRIKTETDPLGRCRSSDYDRLGRTIKVADAAGPTRTSYDAFSRILRQTDASGFVTEYRHDRENRTLTVTSPDGVAVTTRYDQYGEVVAITDGRNIETAYTYDANGNALSIVRGGVSTTTIRREDGLITESVDGAGTRTLLEYDAANRLIRRKVLGSGSADLVTVYEYDAKGLQYRTTDPAGTVTEFKYDLDGRLVQTIVDPGGLRLATSYSYDAQDNVLTVTDPRRSVTRYIYDKLGRRLSEQVNVGGLNLMRTFRYDAAGNVISSTVPGGALTRYTYDDLNREVFRIDPVGSVQELRYDAMSRIVETRLYANAIAAAELGAQPTSDSVRALLRPDSTMDRRERSFYSADGNLAGTVDAVGTVRRFTYDKAGNVIRTDRYRATGTDVSNALPQPATEDAIPVEQYVVYDNLDRAAFSIDGAGGVTAYTYDGCGRVTALARYAKPLSLPRSMDLPDVAAEVQRLATPGSVEVVRHVYDAAGRLTWRVDGAGGVTRNTYDGAGNIVEQVKYANAVGPVTNFTDAALAAAVRPDPADQKTVNRYDAVGRLEWTVDGSGAVTRNRYDANGNLTARIQFANGQAPDAFNPSSQATSPFDRLTRFAYDGANRLLYTADASGAVTGETYDAAGNLTRETRFAQTIGFDASTLDEIRNAIVASAQDRVTQSAYDAAGRRIYVADAEGAVTETRFNVFDQPEMTRQYAVPITLEKLGPTASVTAWRSLLTASGQDRVRYQLYDGAGRLAFAIDPENAVTEQRYDGAGRLESVWMYARPVTSVSGLRTALTADASRDRVERYRYDAAGRLMGRTDALGFEEVFEYDGIGRRTARVDQNRNRWTYSFDAAGRVKSETSPPVDRYRTLTLAGGDLGLEGGLVPASIVTLYTYDGVGNLKSRTEAYGLSEQRTTSYDYDAVGRRVAIRTPNASVYDPASDDLVNSANTARHEVARELIERTRFSIFGDPIATTDTAGQTTHRDYDRMGRIRREADATGHVTAYERNAFGDAEVVRRHANTAVEIVQAGAASTLSWPALSSLDRQTTLRFDRRGRVVETVEQLEHAFDAETGVYVHAPSHGISTFYNAFGEVATVQDGSSITNYFYSRNGRESGRVDAKGYFTSQTYDALGNLLGRTEYATALSATALVNARAGRLPTAPAVSQSDRTWVYLYDALGRKTGESLTGLGATSTAVGTTNAVLAISPPSGPRFQYVPLATADATPRIDIRGSQNVAGFWLQWARPLQGVTTFRWRREGEVVWNEGTDQVLTANGQQTFAFATDMPVGTYEVQVLNELDGQRLAQGLGNLLVTSLAGSAPSLSLGIGSGVPVAGLSMDTLDGGAVVQWRAPAADNTVQFRRRLTGTSEWVVENVQLSEDGVSQYVVLPFDMAGGTYDIQLAVNQHGTTRKERRTNWSYDGLGNVTLERDAEGAETYRYYDGLGRLSAEITPAVDGVAGLPLTQYFHDALGNRLGEAARARGATAVSTRGFVPAATDTADRLQFNKFDSQGHLIQSTDALGVSRFHSYDAAGRLAKSWQTVETDAGLGVAYQVFRYDAAGRLIEQVEPGAKGSGAASASTSMTYDVFGSMTSRTVAGTEREWWQYDTAGRLWKTNEGDGVERVILQDLQGRATMDIRSAGTVDIAAFQTALEAWQALGTRRTITQYDLLGRAVAQTLPQTAQVNGNAEVVRLRATRGAIVSATPQFGVPRWSGENSVQLNWTDLGILGSGDIKVELGYVTKGYDFTGENVKVDPAERVLVRTFTAEAAATGVRLAWADRDDVGGIEGVRGFTVYKKDREGQWQRVIHQARQDASLNMLVIKAPGNPEDEVTVQWKPAGDPASAFVTASSLMRFGDALAFDLTGALDGRFDYEVFTRPAGSDRLLRTSAATLTLSAPPLAALATTVVAQPAEPWILAWSAPAPGVQQDWRYRLSDGTGVWMPLPVTQRPDGRSGVDVRLLPAGKYQFELLHSIDGVAFAHAVGNLDVGGGLPEIDATFTANPDGSAAISWQRQTDVEVVFRYRPAGTTLWELAAPADFITDAQSGRQSVNIVSKKAPGPYETELQFVQGGKPIASHTGVVTVRATAVRPELSDATGAIDSNLPALLVQGAGPLGSTPRLDVRFSTQADGKWQLDWPQPAPRGATVVRFRYGPDTTWHVASAAQILSDGVRQRAVLSPTDWMEGTWEVDIQQFDGRSVMTARSISAVTVHPPAYLLAPFQGASVGAFAAGNSATGEWWIETDAPDRQGADAVELQYRKKDGTTAFSSGAMLGQAINGRVRLSFVASAGDYEVQLVYRRAGQTVSTAFAPVRVGGSRGLPEVQDLAAVPVTLENRTDGTWTLAWPCPAGGIVSQLRVSGGEVLPLTRSGGGEFYSDADQRPPGLYQVELVQTRGGVPVGVYKGILQVADDAVAALPVTRTARDDGSWSLAWAAPPAGTTVHADFGYASTSYRVNRDGWIRQGTSVSVGPWDVVGTAWDLTAGDVVVDVYFQAADGRRVSQGSTLVRLHEPIRATSTWTATPRPYVVAMSQAGVSSQISSAPEAEWAVRSSSFTPIFSTTADGGCRFDWAYPTHTTPAFRYRRWGETDWTMGSREFDINSPGRVTVKLSPALTSGDYEFQILNLADSVFDHAAGTLRIPQPGSAGGAAVASAVVAGTSESLTLQAKTLQRLDRWGNVVEVTDPRNSTWVTRYRYDLNDALIESSRPGPGGTETGSRRTTSWVENDAMGRVTSSTDANGHTTQQRWDRAGNLVGATQADGTLLAWRYDIFNDRIAKVDEAGVETSYSYDALSRLRKTTYGRASSYRFDISKDVWSLVTDTVHPRIVETVDYDRAGRKSRQVNGAGEETLYRYDVRGNLTRSTQGGLTTEWRYDNRGRRIAQTDGEGASSTWTYGDFHLTGHKDIGGAAYSYTYDQANQLVHEVSNVADIARRKDITYAYDTAGHLVRQVDASTNKVSEYTYDLAGNRISERTRQGMVVNGVARYVTYQDNQLAYDALGRLRWVADGRARVEIDYDAAGNRTRIQTHVINGDASQDADLHFQYDVRDRQVVANAVNRHGDLGTSGHRIAYDKAGNKVSDAWQGAVVVQDPLGAYRSAPGLTNETYVRDDLGRITSVRRDGVEIDQRFYDAAGRILQSGTSGLSEAYLSALNGKGANGNALEGNGTELRQSFFDSNGGLRMQQVVKRDRTDFKYRTVYYNEANPSVLNADKAGNLLGYVVVNREANESTAYTYTYRRADGYLQTDLDVLNRTTGKSGHSGFQYDGNGYLVRVEDLQQAGNNRDLVNDAEGRLLYANQGGHVQRQLVANGEVFGRFGEVADEAVPRSRTGISTYKPIADFDFAFAPAAGKPGQLTPSSHVVGAGDTLQSIAHAAYGDSRLWYRIAEANGVLKNSELVSGQVLTIPQAELSLNAASTFKPYDAASAIGDTSPHVPLPPPKKTAWFGQLLALVVTIVVSYFSAGALAAANFGPLSTAMLSAAAGSVAGQTVAVATDAQERFSWKGVALSAVSAGIGQSVPQGFLEGAPEAMRAAGKAMVTNAGTQALGVAMGAQAKFDWRGVAAAGVGAGIGKYMTDPLAKTVENRFMGGLLAGLVAGGAAAAARGRKVAIQQVATDAFGYALGYPMAEESSDRAPATLAPSGQLGSGTLAIPGVDDALDPNLFLKSPSNSSKSADDLLRLNDDPRVMSDWDPYGQQPQAEIARLLLSGRPLARQGVGRSVEQRSISWAGNGAAGQAFLDSVSEVIRETRGVGPTRASMYRDFAVSEKFGQLDQASQALALAGMVSYAEVVNQAVVAEGLEGRTADVAVRYAADTAKQSRAIPEQWYFGAHSRMGAATGVLMLQMPIRHQYEVPHARVTGETESTAIGKSYHSQRAAERRALGEYDMVNEPFVDTNGKPILVTKRVNLKTGEPVVASGTQIARPDSVVFRREVVIDDKPIGRPLNKDQQEVIRFIRAYEVQFGVAPRTIAIERYDPGTMKPVVTELYRPSDFPIRRK